MAYVFPGGYFSTGYFPTGYWPIVDEDIAPPLTLLPDIGWVNGLYSLILVADDNGRLIGELDAEIDGLSWVLNEFGQARLFADPSSAAALLEFGNRLFIYLDNGLPPWVGFIDPPRGWEFGRVKLAAYSGERLMTHRLAGRNQVFGQATRGAIMAALLAGQAGPRVLEPGHIELGGEAVGNTYHSESLYEIARSELFLAAADFVVSGAIENGRLRFRLNVYQRRGRRLANLWLLEGHNAVISPEEQGPIVNEWLAAGAGSGWEDDDRAYSSARDDDSVARFGLRQGSRIFSDTRDQTTLDALTAGELAHSGEPYVAFSVQALNMPPALLADYDVGDDVGIEVYSMLNGYRGLRRVVGRNYRPATGMVETVLI